MMNMTLPLLNRYSRSHEQGITKYLLIPDLPRDIFYTQISNFVVLNMLCRFRRTHPFVALFISDVEFYMQDEASEDFEYYRSLPDLPLASGYSAKYIGLGDISSFIPHGEDESLLFLPQPPPAILPGWHQDIIDLKGVYASQCDDFTTVGTANAQIIKLLDELPQANP